MKTPSIESMTTQPYDRNENESGTAAEIKLSPTFKLIETLRRLDRGYAAAYGARKRRLDASAESIEKELIRRAGEV